MKSLEYPCSLLGYCVYLIELSPSLTEWCLHLSATCEGKNIKHTFEYNTSFIHNNGVLNIKASSEWILLGVFPVLA